MPERAQPPRPAAATRRRVLALLKEDHRAIVAAFAEVDGMQPPIDALTLMARVDAAIELLAAHADLEAVIFYPGVRAVAGEHVDEAEVEHAAMATLMAQIQAGGPSDAKYVARFKVLGEYMRHHLREEEGALFGALGEADLPWDEIEARLLLLRDPPAEEPPPPPPPRKRAPPKRE